MIDRDAFAEYVIEAREHVSGDTGALNEIVSRCERPSALLLAIADAFHAKAARLESLAKSKDAATAWLISGAAEAYSYAGDDCIAFAKELWESECAAQASWSE